MLIHTESELQHSMNQPRRVPVPIPDGFGEIARRERRSIAGQAVVVLEQFVEHWRSALPSQDRTTQPNIQKHQ